MMEYDDIGKQLETVSLQVSNDGYDATDNYDPELTEDLGKKSVQYEESNIINYTTCFNLVAPYDKPDIRNVKYITATDHLNCPVCQQPFIEPLTTLCGHTFCKECIFECFKMSRDISQENMGICPLDRTPIDGNNTDDLFPTPILINNLVDDLRVYCLNNERGCTWIGCRWEIDHHVLSDCQYTGVECNGERENGEICKLLVERRFKEDGKEGQPETLNHVTDPAEITPNHKDDTSDNIREDLDDAADDDDVHDDEVQELDQLTVPTKEKCIHELFQCKYCITKITKISESHHLSTECLFNYQTCDLCLNDMIPLKSLESHKQYCIKLNKFICPANEIGCKFIGNNQPSLENHINNNCQLHNFLPFYNSLNDRLNDLSNENTFLQKQINKILNLIIQGKITNLGYNEPVEEIGKFKGFNDMDQDKLIYLNYELERLKYQVDEKLIPFVNKQTNEREPILNNLVNDNFMMKDDLNLQRMLINSLRKQIQFILFKNHRPAFNGLNNVNPVFDEDLSDSDERLNLKL